MTDHTAAIQAVLTEHEAKRPWTDAAQMKCKCGARFIAEHHPALYSLHRAHQAEVIAAMLAPVIADAVAHERHHTIQQIRDAAEHTPDQTGDYGRVELEGYLSIGTRELGKIEAGTGFDRMCMSVLEWEAGIEAAQREAWAEGHATPVKRGPDECMCGAWSGGECACGKYGTGPIITTNPYGGTDE